MKFCKKVVRYRRILNKFFCILSWHENTVSLFNLSIKQFSITDKILQNWYSRNSQVFWYPRIFSHFQARLEINDLFVDLCDGIMLMKLLEIISGDKLGKPNRGRMRVHKIENLNRVLDYLKKKRITLENIGAEDIQDGNPRLILGLIWTIILRFIIEPIEIPAVKIGNVLDFSRFERNPAWFCAWICAVWDDQTRYPNL